MGIVVEHDFELALVPYDSKGRKREECLPERLFSGTTNWFLKRGQIDYPIQKEIPLREARGSQTMSRPLASISILEATHFSVGGEIWTKGKYEIREVYDPKDPTIYFEGLQRVVKND